MKVRAYEFDLSIPRDDYEIVEPGTELTVDVCTGEAWVRIGSKDLDPIPLHRIGSVHNASFTKLYLTNRSQPGKVLRFYVGFDVKISRAYLTFQDILSVISDQKRLIEEFTSKDIIKQLVLNNIITGEMIKYNEIMEHHIADRQITSRLLDTTAVGTEHIKREAIVSDLIASNSILAHHIAAGAITSDHITTQAILSYHIAANSILAHHIYAGAITATHIAASSISVEKLESTLYGDLIQYITLLRAHQVSAESVSFTITEGIFSDGTLENCYGIMYYGNFHIYSMTLNRWDDESLTWDDDDLRWDVPTHEISVWESDVFQLDNVLTASLSVDLVANDYESLSVYAKFSVDNQQWSDWEELRSYHFSNRWIFSSVIRDFKYFRIKLIFSGYTDIYDVKIFAMSALLNADMLNGKRDTDFASANHDHDSVYASINHTHDATYVRKLVSDTITAVHTFNPSTVGAPFVLGANAQNQLVVGLNSDTVDGKHWQDIYQGVSKITQISDGSYFSGRGKTFKQALIDDLRGAKPDGWDTSSETTYGYVQSGSALGVTIRPDDVPFTGVKSFAVETATDNKYVTGGWSTHGTKITDMSQLPEQPPVTPVIASVVPSGDWGDLVVSTQSYTIPNNGAFTVSGWVYVKGNKGAFNVNASINDSNTSLGSWTDLPHGWHYLKATWVNNTDADATVSAICIENGLQSDWENNDNQAWGCNYQLELLPFATSFVNGTRPAGRLYFPLSQLGFDPANDEWVIAYWKKPIGTHNNTLNGNNAYAIGYYTDNNDVGYTWWGKGPSNQFACVVIYNDGTARGSESNTFDPNWYFNNWHFEVVRKADGKLEYWVDGVKQCSITLTKPIKPFTEGLYVGGVKQFPAVNALTANLYWGKAKDRNGNLIWTDEFIQELYQYRRPFLYTGGYSADIRDTTNHDVVHYRSLLLPIDTRTVEIVYTGDRISQILTKDGSTVISTADFSYDVNGRVQTVTQTAGGKTVSLTLSYSNNKLSQIVKSVS